MFEGCSMCGDPDPIPEGYGHVCYNCLQKWSGRKDSMQINDYQMMAMRTANMSLTNTEALTNGLMGLNGEAGEAIDLLKKHLFQGHPLNKNHMAKELGDIAWYLAVSAHAIDYPLDQILIMNIEKLKERYPNGFDENLSRNRKTGDI